HRPSPLRRAKNDSHRPRTTGRNLQVILLEGKGGPGLHVRLDRKRPVGEVAHLDQAHYLGPTTPKSTRSVTSMAGSTPSPSTRSGGASPRRIEPDKSIGRVGEKTSWSRARSPRSSSTKGGTSSRPSGWLAA